MSMSARAYVLCLFGLCACSQMGCNTVPGTALRSSQIRSRQLYEQNKSLAAHGAQANGMMATLATDKQRLAQQNANLQSQLEIANSRVTNLQSERSKLQQRFASLVNSAKQSPLSPQATRNFEELARKYPHFEFDPQTGVSKFHSDILFGSGSAQLADRANPVLTDFAKIMNDGDAQRLNILIVGHTDDKPIVKGTTKRTHPTNGHLSTNRAHSVRMALIKSGITDARMGVAGYGMHQPLSPNKDEASRRQNRRVEIFVLAPDAVVAGWEPEFLRN